MSLAIDQEVVVRKVQLLVDRCARLQRRVKDLTTANRTLLNQVASLYDEIHHAKQRCAQHHALLAEVFNHGHLPTELHGRIQAALRGDH